MGLSRYLAFLLMSLVAGCARFHPQPLSPSTTAGALENRSLTNAALRTFLERNLQHELTQWPLETWDFKHLTLVAFYFRPELDVARAQWDVAMAGRRTAGERPNPTVGVAPAYDTTTGIPSPWIVTATLDIPIETAGKRGYRIARAGQLSEAARMNVASVAWQVRGRVRAALLDLYGARELEALLKQQQSVHGDNVRLLELQHQAGAISAFELTQSRLAADSARLALRDAERQRAEARVQLAAALGVPVRALDEVNFSFQSLSQLPADLPPAAARHEALLNRADILGALAEYAASQSALQLEIAKQYPDVHLGPGYEYDQGDNKWSLGISVTLPVFNRNQGAIAEAKARRDEAAARFNALQAKVLAEIDLAVAGYRAASRKQADADAMLADLTKHEKAARAMFDAGEISKTELAGLQLQLGATALARLDALVKAQQAAGLLEEALQTPLGFPAAAWQTPPRPSEIEGAKDRP